MIRHCDGTDPNLVMLVDPASGDRVTPQDAVGKLEQRPCDCGLRFDDARRMVIWPHREV